MKLRLLILPFLAALSLLHAEERTLTPEQMEALASEGELTEETQPVRPGNLPDLTKGEPLLPGPKGGPPQEWTLGPTGIIGVMSGKKFEGDQIQVQAVMKGSPADGKLQWGDVITGINGKPFVAGGHLGETVGNAIIEAELEPNQGKFTLQIWRDKNFTARHGKQDIAGVDVDEIFTQARDDNSLYEWKPEEERQAEVTKLGFDKFPIDGTRLEVELTLRTLPAYADTAPYDCPKTAQILENAWKVLEKKFQVDPQNPRSGRGGIIEAIALISSGKPEHRELVRQWVRGKHSPWNPPTQAIGAMFDPGYRGNKGYQSWHHGFNGLYCALYYDATGDEYVLPALRKYAIEAAMGQSLAGSWGHTFAYPSFNGGQFHMMNPGYGALNAAGNRCFFLIALAQKHGIEHPEIDLAVERAHRFFGSYVDQGAIPYGDHVAAGTDDSNGKNTGIAFAMKILGDNYGAKYFAMMSSHCAFTRRGGHGHDYHGNWSSWAATLCGPEIRTYNERNLRWRRTLCRLHDGSFAYNSPTGTYKALRDPTATEVLHQAVIHKQTLITGKDDDPSLHPNEREMKQLLTIAKPQFNDPHLIELAGKSWPERDSAELLDFLNVFLPKTRGSIAAELGKRFQAGEKNLLAKLEPLLQSEDARFRDGALKALQACGTDTVLSVLSKITPLLDDPKDFVRITAVKVISDATQSEETQLAMLNATVHGQTTAAPNSFQNAIQKNLFSKKTQLGDSPFSTEFDPELVERALEIALLEETGAGDLITAKLGAWDKDTVVRLAGPLTYLAEQEQVVDQMFGARSQAAQAMLGKFGYREALVTSAQRLRQKAALPRLVRPFVDYKDPIVNPEVIKKQPAAFHDLIGPMETVLIDNPSETITIKDDSTNWKPVTTTLESLYNLIKSTKAPADLPSVATDVRRMFQAELDQADGTGAKMKICRETLADPARKNYFRKIAAMDFLTEILGHDALEDLLPYLGHDYWRLRDHSQSLAAGLVTVTGADQLAAHFPKATSSQTAVGILEVLARTDADTGLALAKEALKNETPSVRAAAIKTYASLGREKVIPEILDHLKNATTQEDLRGCEEALLTWREDPTQIAKIRDALIALRPAAELNVRQSIDYLLSQIGDPPSIAALREAAETDNLTEFDNIIFALSYSPSREADKLMLDLAAADKRIAKAIGSHSVRRMVLGPKGFGDITVAEKLDFAEAMLKLDLDRHLIQYLGQVHEARALRALMFALENGVESAAESLISCAEGMDKLSTTDAKIAAQSLQDVIEYIEVTRLRGGVKAHMDKKDNYTGWKALQARAGKVLLKVHKPEEAPIPEFDPLEFE